MLRKSMFSGINSFYPDNPTLLNLFFNNNTNHGIKKITALSAICPHAGYVYSAKTALRALEQIQIPNHVVLIGPNHRSFGPVLSIMTSGEWEIPGTKITINERLAESLIQNSLLLTSDVLAHQYEHSLEVILPMLNYFNPNISIVPIVMRCHSDSYWKDLADSLVIVSQLEKEPFLVIASTDMTHFETREQAKFKDNLAFDKIRNLDASGLIETVNTNNISMCGSGPVAATISYSKRKGAVSAQLIDYTDSGFVTKDIHQVVSYASFIIT